MVTENRAGRAPADDSDSERRADAAGKPVSGTDGRADWRPALGDLEKYRAYLLLLANRELAPELRHITAPSDLVQESLIDAQQSLADFAGSSEEQLLGWLRRILLNNAADHARRHRQAATRTLSFDDQPAAQLQKDGLPLVDPRPTPADAAIEAERVERLRRAIEQLPAEYRVIVQLRNFELLTFAEIGEQLGKAAGTVCRTWYRAIEQLERMLGEQPSAK
jgi:RNA polymerase sigma-70 factor, ECF subfamily